MIGRVSGIDDDHDDPWPKSYNPGNPKHLHALGAIAILYASLERSVDDLFRLQPSPVTDAEFVAFSGKNGARRVRAIRNAFKAEPDQRVRTAVDSVLAYFERCNTNRNELLHAEQYPALFGGDPESLYMIKRQNKQSLKSVYIKLSLLELRSISDNMRAGVVHCAELHIYLRHRGIPKSKIHSSLHPYCEAPPEPIEPPPLLHLPTVPQT